MSSKWIIVFQYTNRKYRKEDREKEREEMKMEEGEEIGENKNPPEENKKLCTQEGDNEEQIMKP